VTFKRKVDTSPIDDRLRNWLSNSQRVVVAGIGNPLRKDDFVGVKIVRDLGDKVSTSIYLIECETVPESFMGPIEEFKPTHILIIDAALLHLKPGSTRLVDSTQLAESPAISTHALPLKIFCEYLEKTTGAEIALLAIQPGNASFGENLTAELEKTAKGLTSLLSKILP
jgi:hydrogenase 3 maturation protease